MAPYTENAQWTFPNNIEATIWTGSISQIRHIWPIWRSPQYPMVQPPLELNLWLPLIGTKKWYMLLGTNLIVQTCHIPMHYLHVVVNTVQLHTKCILETISIYLGQDLLSTTHQSLIRFGIWAVTESLEKCAAEWKHMQIWKLWK